MRPLTLTITAFGPYASRQVIDFSELKGRNLFVITGDTGAGKTTILDGISYALYGRASGRDRDGESLRSHFAPADLLTTVELEFELRGQRYWVQRIPKQRKKRTRGEGYTDQNAEAEFKNLDGESRIVNGVKEVNEKIIQLMGLSYDQFKQIIMIPQGEFRELLTADSKMRQEILQKIFGTEGFRRIQDLFEGQAKSLSQAISQLESQRNEWIRSLDGSGYPPLLAAAEKMDLPISLVLEEIKRAIELDDASGKTMEIQIGEYEAKVTAKQEEIFQGKSNNLKFSIRDEAEQKKIKLEACQPQFDEKKGRLQQGRKALGLAGVDDYRKNRRDYVEKKKIELADLITQEEKGKVAAEAAEKNYQLENGKEDQRNELLLEQPRLQELAVKVADWEERQTLALTLENELAILQKKLDQGKEQLEETANEAKECQANLEQERGAMADFARKALEQEKVNEIYSKCKTLQEECNGLSALENSTLILKEQTTQQFLRYEKAQSDYEEAQRLFFAGQAGVLAAKIKAGECCPVCGSEHHPQLAALSEKIPMESELKEIAQNTKQAREVYDEMKGRYEGAKADCHARGQILLRLQKELGEKLSDSLSELNVIALIEYIEKKLLEYQSICERLEDEIRKIPRQKKNEQELGAELIQKTETMGKLTSDLNALELQYMKLFAQVQSAKDALEGLAAQLPQEVGSIASLRVKLEQVKKQYNVMKQALEKAEAENRNSQAKYAAAVAERSSAEKALQEGQEELVLAQQTFVEALVTAGFASEAEYRMAKLSEEEITRLEKEINRYQEELRSSIDYYIQVQGEVEALSIVDVMALETEHLALQMEKKQHAAEHAALMGRVRHNKMAFDKICNVMEKMKDQEEEYLLIGHLARIAKGDNEEKISFERYVLAAFFNDIIDAGNDRLKKMTGGRYQMSRITQKGKGNGQSGLEIEVFDYYTGQSRHVKTLSGGESFKASLALALGLAEVVQRYAGGISLETMFIDEGFGTLDPESLDTAISCLIELQHSGRLVGIISHVPELKGSIDARLEIEAYKDGSRASFCIM